MLFTSVTRHIELCGPFFKLLTLLTESSGGPSGLPCFSQLVLSRVWDAAEFCPQSALDWLAVQAPRNKIAHAWILQSAESWVEQFLLAHNNAKVRNGKNVQKPNYVNKYVNTKYLLIYYRIIFL